MGERAWKEDFEDGVNFLKMGRYREAVYNFHTCGTMLVEDYYGAPRGEFYFSEGMRKLFGDGVINQDELDALMEINELRNKIYHRGYKPLKEEAERAKEIIKGLISKLMGR